MESENRCAHGRTVDFMDQSLIYHGLITWQISDPFPIFK